MLPAFAESLGASNVVIGAIPALMTVGWFLPSLLVASYTEALPRRLPFVLRWTVWERVPYLALALVAFYVASPAPSVALALLLGLLLVATATGGILMPAWMDIVGRAIPMHLRGRFFALTSVAGSALGMAGSAFTAWILGTVSGPIGYGWCFTAATVCMVLSYVALAATREPPLPPPPAAVPLPTYLRRMPSLLRGDRNFSRFLMARAFSSAATMASGFFTVYALRAFDAQPWHVGTFTTVLLCGQMAGNLAFGWLADRSGHRVVLLVGAASLVLASAVAAAVSSLNVYPVVFALTGMSQAASHVSGLNVLLEFAPSVTERPTYVGLGTTGIGPVLFASPLLGGVLVDAVGFPAVFSLAAALGAIGFVLLAGVSDPRRRRE